MKRLFAACGMAFFSLFVAAPSAGATSTGPCQGSLNGKDVAPLSTSNPNDAIKVSKEGDITASVSSSGPLQRYHIDLEYAGVRWTVADGDTSGRTWSKTVKVKDYARFAVGLYRVHAVSTGSTSCEGSALVEVTGSPFTTVAGIAGTALVAIAVGSAVVMGIRSGRAAASRAAA